MQSINLCKHESVAMAGRVCTQGESLKLLMKEGPKSNSSMMMCSVGSVCICLSTPLSILVSYVFKAAKHPAPSFTSRRCSSFWSTASSSPIVLLYIIALAFFHFSREILLRVLLSLFYHRSQLPCVLLIALESFCFYSALPRLVSFVCRFSSRARGAI